MAERTCFYCEQRAAIPNERFCNECGKEMAENAIEFLTSTIEVLEKMVVFGEQILAEPSNYGLDKDSKMREGILLMANTLRAKKEVLEGQLRQLER